MRATSPPVEAPPSPPAGIWRRRCLRRWLLVWKALPQVVHGWSRAPVWTTTCFCRKWISSLKLRAATSGLGFLDRIDLFSQQASTLPLDGSRVCAHPPPRWELRIEALISRGCWWSGGGCGACELRRASGSDVSRICGQVQAGNLRLKTAVGTLLC